MSKGTQATPYVKAIYNADTSYRNILMEVKMKGEVRQTRSGEVRTVFSPSNFVFNMKNHVAPLLTGKQIMVQPMIGELLWFFGGDHSIHQLQERTFGEADGQKTIWTPDQERWFDSLSPETQALLKYPDDLGRTYGRQWRNSAGKFGTEVDQIVKLVKGLKENPHSRYHIVNNWNAAEVDANMMALAPCHTMFQCFVSNEGKLSLKWYQRSVDCFLGLPFNIASYGLLLSILCQLTGYNWGTLTGTFGDTHIYTAHNAAVAEYLKNPVYQAPTIQLPSFSTIEDVEKMTALDFRGCYVDYKHSGKVSAPLLVG